MLGFLQCFILQPHCCACIFAPLHSFFLSSYPHPDSGKMDPKHHLAHARVSAFNICIWYVVSLLPPADSAWRLTVERAQLLFRSRHGDTVQFRELRAVGWRLLLPDSLTASQGVLCGGAAVFFSCLYCSLSQPCWQGLAGELAQHFSYCYVSVPGLWTACRGHTRSRVPVAVQCVVSSFT